MVAMRHNAKKNSKIPEAKTREAILLAAIEEFAAHGFAGARTENIARVANVNKAMVHYYYHDKETLYEAVLETLYGAAPEAEALVQKLTAVQINSVQHVHIFLKVILNKHADPRSYAFRCILAWELAAGQKNLKHTAQKYLVPRILGMTEVLKRGVVEGELKCSNPTLAVWSLISQVAFYFMHRQTYEGSAIYDELYESVTSEDLLNFLLDNFISAYAIDPKINSALPEGIGKDADALGRMLAAPALPAVH